MMVIPKFHTNNLSKVSAAVDSLSHLFPFRGPIFANVAGLLSLSEEESSQRDERKD